MECNRRRSGTTVAHRWRAWIDPRLPLLVLDSGNLYEVTWEQREMEGDPKFAASQTAPQVPYADYAQALGLGATKLRAPPRWDRRGMRPWRPIGHHHQERPAMMEPWMSSTRPTTTGTTATSQQRNSMAIRYASGRDADACPAKTCARVVPRPCRAHA